MIWSQRTSFGASLADSALDPQLIQNEFEEIVGNPDTVLLLDDRQRLDNPCRLAGNIHDRSWFHEQLLDLVKCKRLERAPEKTPGVRSTVVRWTQTSLRRADAQPAPRRSRDAPRAAAPETHPAAVSAEIRDDASLRSPELRACEEAVATITVGSADSCVKAAIDR
jgi:hypothetical protein